MNQNKDIIRPATATAANIGVRRSAAANVPAPPNPTVGPPRPAANIGVPRAPRYPDPPSTPERQDDDADDDAAAAPPPRRRRRRRDRGGHNSPPQPPQPPQPPPGREPEELNWQQLASAQVWWPDRDEMPEHVRRATALRPRPRRSRRK